MKNITDLEVRQLRIFPADALPFGRLVTPAVGKAFKERFSWGKAEVNENEVLWHPGLFPSPDVKDAVAIKGFQLSERRMILSVAGDSAMANSVHEGIVDFLREATGWQPVEPLILTEETTCVATLGFDWTALLSPAMREFVQGPMVERIFVATNTKPEVRGLSLSFRLAYPETPRRLQEHGVTLADKQLTVEPRVNTPLSERRYYTFSPTDSETHRELLKLIEGALTESAPAGRRRR